MSSYRMTQKIYILIALSNLSNKSFSFYLAMSVHVPHVEC